MMWEEIRLISLDIVLFITCEIWLSYFHNGISYTGKMTSLMSILNQGPGTHRWNLQMNISNLRRMLGNLNSRPNRRQAIIWTSDQDIYWHMASPDHKELMLNLHCSEENVRAFKYKAIIKFGPSVTIEWFCSTVQLIPCWPCNKVYYADSKYFIHHRMIYIH